MDEQRIKQAVLGVLDRALDAGSLARAVQEAGGHAASSASEPPAPSPGTKKLLERIVLGDILDDAILSARPQDRTFPLRLFFGELGTLLAKDDGEGEEAFTLASGLNFFFRASAMDGEAKVRLGIEVSRQLYALAHAARMDPELVGKAAPLLAALMSQDLERVRLESVDHMKVFDSQVHERAAGSDSTAARILRPATFLCRVATNNAVKAKAQVVT